MKSNASRWRVGVDVGGTFTDVVAFDTTTGHFMAEKVPSTKDDPSDAIIVGLQRLVQRGVSTDELGTFLHGTTVTTNALIERNGARVALLLTRGMRGVPAVRRQTRTGRVVDVAFKRPDPIVAPSDVYEVSERVAANGEVVSALDVAELRETIEQVSEKGIVSIAVCLLFSYLDSRHEELVQATIQEIIPSARVSLSSQVLPRVREWPRMSGTVLNAYLDPLLREYVERLDEKLSAEGVRTEERFLMQSGGGLMHFRAAKGGNRTINTLLSGPAGGVNAGRAIATIFGESRVITIDVGGTSCDIGFIIEGKPLEQTEVEVEGYTVAVPTFDITAIGAGGGTIATVDSGGALKVGPKSAGASPGPTGYQRGGMAATVTDANLTLGFLGDGQVFGDGITLSRTAAESVIQRKIAEPLGTDVRSAANAVLEVLNTRMADAIRLLAAKRGVELDGAAILAGGGAAGLHALAIAEELGIDRVIFPAQPGLFSALGLLCTDVVHDYVRSILKPWYSLDAGEVEREFQALQEQADKEFQDEGLTARSTEISRSVDVRFAGQGTELQIPAPTGPLTAAVLDNLAKMFHLEHRRRRGHGAEGGSLELVSCRVRATVRVPQLDLRSKPSDERNASLTRRTRQAVFDGESLDTAVLSEGEFDRIKSVTGPTIVEMATATVVVRPGWECRSNPGGALCTRSGATAALVEH